MMVINIYPWLTKFPGSEDTSLTLYNNKKLLGVIANLINECIIHKNIL